MNTLTGLFQYLTNLLKWWVSVMPWETGIRVKFGKHITLLPPGVHLRVPLVHTVYKQCSRLRRTDLPTQTITTADGKTVTLGATIGFRIADIKKLYHTLYHADATLAILAQSRVAEYINTHVATECSPAQISKAVNQTLDFEQYGLAEATVTITDFAFVKTFRLIQDSRWGHSGKGLNMDLAVNEAATP